MHRLKVLQDERSALEEDVFRVVSCVQRGWTWTDVVCLTLQEVEASYLCVLPHLHRIQSVSGNSIQIHQRQIIAGRAYCVGDCKGLNSEWQYVSEGL